MLEKISRFLTASKFYQARSSVTLSNNATKILKLTVPDGKVWVVHGIMMHNGDDVARDLSVKILDGSDNVLHQVSFESSVGSGGIREMLGYINTAAGNNYAPFQQDIKIKGGNKLYLEWTAGGASSGGTAYYCVSYEEMLE